MTPRQEAIAAGKRRYFTGKPCPKGHISERAVANSGCVACAADIRARNVEKQRAYTREHYRINREDYLEKAAAWDSENPDKVRAAKRKWRCENREAGNAASSKWQKNNPDRVLANVREWRRNNPERFKAVQVNRRARLAEVGGSISGDEIRAIVARQKGKCAACGCRAKLEMDHVMPVALGGSGDAKNFQGLCRPCNRRKSAKHPVDFNRSIGLLL